MILSDYKLCSIDTEFNNSAEYNVMVVCCSLSTKAYGVEEFWTFNNPEESKRCADRLVELGDEGYHFIAHAATAEGRAFLALGLLPIHFSWFDTYLIRKQLINKCDKYTYGRYFRNGVERYSVPPHLIPWKNAGKDNYAIGAGLAETVGRHLGFCIDTDHKDKMRDIIIHGTDEEIEANREHIQKYCTSDILYLDSLLETMLRDYQTVNRLLTEEQMLKAFLKMGRFAADTAMMEQIGIPLDVEAIKNLIDNYDIAKDELITELVENYFPFYVREKVPGKIVPQWKFKSSLVVAFIESKGLERTWPKTDKGSYKTDDDTLSTYDHLPEIKALRECNKQVTQLKWFRPEAGSDFFASVGSDGCLRTFLNPYGTLSSRNAPPAKRFPFAMSSWIRAIIRPPVGEVILGNDFSSQEYIIAAVLGGDDKMFQGYCSGDPYRYMGVLAGAIPENSCPKLTKNPYKILDEFKSEFANVYALTKEEKMRLKESHPVEFAKFTEYLEYLDQRSLMKSTTLGLQFGMMPKSLSSKLTIDMGREVPLKEAERLAGIHKSLFKNYWRWTDVVLKNYRQNKACVVWDGWTLLGDNESDLSMKNFPVQSSGAVIMRVAVKKAHDAGLRVMNPLHDALYVRTTEDKAEEHSALLSKLMIEATVEVLGQKGAAMRVDADIHRHDEVWIEDKGRKNYERLGKFLMPIKNSEANVRKRLEGLLCQIS